MPYRVNHSADLWTIFFHDNITNSLQPESAKSFALAWDVCDLGTKLCHFDSTHHAPALLGVLAAATARAIAFGATSSKDLPRRAAIFSGDSSILSAAAVA